MTQWQRDLTPVNEASIHKAVGWLEGIKAQGVAHVALGLTEVSLMRSDHVYLLLRSCPLEVHIEFHRRVVLAFKFGLNLKQKFKNPINLLVFLN